jgi:uncharacterized protein (TIGR00251 family)
MSTTAKLEVVEHDGRLTFSVRVLPRASRTEVVGLYDGAMKLRLAAPPVDGAANGELIRVLAKALEISQNQVELLRGQTGRLKVVRVPSRCRDRLTRLVSAAGVK